MHGNEQNRLRIIGYWRSMRLAFTNPQNWLCGIYTSLLNLPIFIFGGLWGNGLLDLGARPIARARVFHHFIIIFGNDDRIATDGMDFRPYRPTTFAHDARFTVCHATHRPFIGIDEFIRYPFGSYLLCSRPNHQHSSVELPHGQRKQHATTNRHLRERGLDLCDQWWGDLSSLFLAI